MWSVGCARQHLCRRRLVPLGRFPKKVLQNRFLSQKIPPLSQQTIPPKKRIVVCLIAFTTGFSIYFFLDDPSSIPPITLGISPRVFTASKLISSEFSGPNTKLLKFAAPRSFLAAQPSTDGFDPIWSVYIKDDDIQVERAYTPLMGVDGDGNLLFWVKKYPKGEVGRWLHSKIPGDSIEMRGPLKTWPWKEDAYDEIVMVSTLPCSVRILHDPSC
jgi:cytochrome-b5 reductase